MSEHIKPTESNEAHNEIIFTEDNPEVLDPLEDTLPSIKIGEKGTGYWTSRYSEKDAITGELHDVYKAVTRVDGELLEVTVINGEIQFDKGQTVKVQRTSGEIVDDARVAGYKFLNGKLYIRTVFEDKESGNMAMKDVPADVLRSLNQPEAAEETDLEMYDRFIRESQKELKDLYAAHRQEPVGSDEQFRLEREIENVKSDIGKYMKQQQKLRGQ